MSDLFDEIKEDIKQERIFNILQKYGVHLIVICLIVIFLTAAIVWYRNYKIATLARAGDEFYHLLGQNGNVKDIDIEEFEKLISANSGNYSALAGITKANILSQEGNIEEANKIYLKIANNNNFAIEFKDFAKIAHFYNILNQHMQGSVIDFDKQLQELSRQDRPWRFLAMEIRAHNALVSGNKELAITIFNEIISHPAAPESLKHRTEEVVAAIK